LAVEPDSCDNLAAELTTMDEGDASLAGPLLDPIDGSVFAVLADGAYDGTPTWRTVLGGYLNVAVVIGRFTPSAVPRRAFPRRRE
jgi:hypothetical protein